MKRSGKIEPRTFFSSAVNPSEDEFQEFIDFIVSLCPDSTEEDDLLEGPEPEQNDVLQ